MYKWKHRWGWTERILYIGCMVGAITFGIGIIVLIDVPPGGKVACSGLLLFVVSLASAGVFEE